MEHYTRVINVKWNLERLIKMNNEESTISTVSALQRIKELEKQIEELHGRITGLNDSMEKMTKCRDDANEARTALETKSKELQQNFDALIAKHAQSERINQIVRAQNYYLKKCIVVEIGGD